MSMIRYLTVLLVLVASATPALAGGTTTETGTGPKICNCTSGSISVQQCHQSSVSISMQVGASAGPPQASFSAGWGSIEQTGQETCTTSTLLPGTCQYYEYTFQCVYEFYWISAFNSKTCTLDKTVLQEERASPADCRK